MSNPYVVAGGGDAWSVEAAAIGRVGTQRLLGVRVADPVDEVRMALGLKDGEQVVCRSRLILLDEVPVEIADSFYPASFAADTELSRPGKIRGGAVGVLSKMGKAAAEVAEMVTARLPDPYEMDNLAIEPREPLLVLTRISREISGGAVEYAVNRMVASRTQPLRYRMRVTSA